MANGQRIGYARVSTAGQDLSLQRDRLSDCDKIFEEKASGARGTGRPALEEALNYVRDGDVFVVSKLDRLARSVLELMQITQVLQEKKCDLQALDQELDTSTPTGRLIFHVLAVIGEFERELITERAREGRERAMAAGVKFGRKPKLSKRKERELLEMLETVVISKEELARQFNVSRATVYRLAAKLDKDFEEQLQQA
ncbi:recombinase family protein [uncultured Desulfuromusa sp.]|uniref:recombinase family protein n=1 Tax=uncultured Desulfuromusa sp. TaxID=219183 RepID=UPI002AA66CD8|nr:recombinase family protein [uncultured Desulfuromusa sp.]